MVAVSRCSPLDKPRGERAWWIVRARCQVRGAGFLPEDSKFPEHRRRLAIIAPISNLKRRPPTREYKSVYVPTSAEVRDILEAVAARCAIEEHFHDVKDSRTTITSSVSRTFRVTP